MSVYSHLPPPLVVRALIYISLGGAGLSVKKRLCLGQLYATISSNPLFAPASLPPTT